MFSRDFQGAYSAGAHFTGELGFEVRTFECSICDPTEQVLDCSWNPIKTDAVGARGRTPAGTPRPSPFASGERSIAQRHPLGPGSVIGPTRTAACRPQFGL